MFFFRIWHLKIFAGKVLKMITTHYRKNTHTIPWFFLFFLLYFFPSVFSTPTVHVCTLINAMALLQQKYHYYYYYCYYCFHTQRQRKWCRIKPQTLFPCLFVTFSSQVMTNTFVKQTVRRKKKQLITHSLSLRIPRTEELHTRTHARTTPSGCKTIKKKIDHLKKYHSVLYHQFDVSRKQLVGHWKNT